MSSTEATGQQSEEWYAYGLAFECTRCGACCTGSPGYVWVTPEEIERLAEFRGESVRDFSLKFVRRVGNDYSLIEKPGGDCVFWDKRVGCTVYPARPVQCRTWPFWADNVESPETWARAGMTCPGLNIGPLYSIEAIRAAVEETGF